MKNPLVSIIVPIYNVEKYLNKCVDSIINQTLSNIEIILVNDGSTDNCGIIIDEYANKDNRIVAIHKENGGQSSARNMGLDIAKGKYIGFVDSDDWVDLNMYENLYTEIEQSNSDICVCGRRAYSENGEVYNQVNIQEEEFRFDKDLLQDYIVNRLLYKHTVVVWNKIYRKEIIEKNRIRFEDVSHVGSEDILFNYNMLCNVNKIKAIGSVYYNQLSREGSTARSYKAGYMDRTANLLKCMHTYSKKIGKVDLAKEILPIILLFFYQWNISQIITYSDKNKQLTIKKELKIGMKTKELRRYVGKLGFNLSNSSKLRSMGFRLQGRLKIRLIMILATLKLYNFAARVTLIK